MNSSFLVHQDISLAEALEALKRVKGIGLVVVDCNDKLLGSLTDGDIRRALATGADLHHPIEKFYNKNPKYISVQEDREKLEELTADKKIKVVPIINGHKVVDIFSVADDDTKEASVVIMAGGLGSRLGELTQDCPKPMLEVAGKPVLQRIIENFTDVGFEKIYISVNYKAEVIEDYFKDGAAYNCSIEYLKEEKRLGTAGSLSLLPKHVQGPIVVTNGDILTLVDFRRLLNFHKEHKSPITMCTRKFEFQVPFGVVNIKNGQAQSIDEKPVQSFDVNAGVYVIDKELLSYIPQKEYFDMPTLLEKLMEKEIKADCFPMYEQWIDIGQVSDLDYARSIYGNDDD
jgi:dTDP-glucose pyrophosphorylase